jgi:hypothetical protein
MGDFGNLGKLLIFMGLIIVGLGLLLTLGPKIPFLGRLPGDIRFQKGPFTFYFPIVTCILISLILTFIFNIFKK